MIHNQIALKINSTFSHDSDITLLLMLKLKDKNELRYSIQSIRVVFLKELYSRIHY